MEPFWSFSICCLYKRKQALSIPDNRASIILEKSCNNFFKREKSNSFELGLIISLTSSNLAKISAVPLQILWIVYWISLIESQIKPQCLAWFCGIQVGFRVANLTIILDSSLSGENLIHGWERRKKKFNPCHRISLRLFRAYRSMRCQLQYGWKDFRACFWITTFWCRDFERQNCKSHFDFSDHKWF